MSPYFLYLDSVLERVIGSNETVKRIMNTFLEKNFLEAQG